jgi:hypothetical protein
MKATPFDYRSRLDASHGRCAVNTRLAQKGIGPFGQRNSNVCPTKASTFALRKHIGWGALSRSRRE